MRGLLLRYFGRRNRSRRYRYYYRYCRSTRFNLIRFNIVGFILLLGPGYGNTSYRAGEVYALGNLLISLY